MVNVSATLLVDPLPLAVTTIVEAVPFGFGVGEGEGAGEGVGDGVGMTVVEPPPHALTVAMRQRARAQVITRRGRGLLRTPQSASAQSAAKARGDVRNPGNNK